MSAKLRAEFTASNFFVKLHFYVTGSTEYESSYYLTVYNHTQNGFQKETESIEQNRLQFFGEGD